MGVWWFLFDHLLHHCDWGTTAFRSIPSPKWDSVRRLLYLWSQRLFTRFYPPVGKVLLPEFMNYISGYKDHGQPDTNCLRSQFHLPHYCLASSFSCEKDEVDLY